MSRRDADEDPCPPSLDVEAHALVIARRAAPWAPLARLARGLIAMLPRYRDTRRGRQWIGSFKTGAFLLGVVTVLYERSALSISLATLLFTAALTLPLSELQRRSLIIRAERLQTRARATRQPLRVTLEPRRLVVLEDSALERRVLTNRAFTLRVGHTPDAAPCLLVRGASKKKRDAVVLISDPADPADPADPDSAPSAPLDPQALTDRPVHVSATDWRRLRDALTERARDQTA